MSYTKGGQSQKGYWHTGKITKQALYCSIKEAVDKNKASAASMLKKFKLSKSGYYEYLKRVPCKQKERKETITVKIKELHDQSKQIYGAPKITLLLRRNGFHVSEKYVGNIMRDNGWKACYIKHYIQTTKDCDYTSKLRNIVDRNFSPDKPKQHGVLISLIFGHRKTDLFI